MEIAQQLDWFGQCASLVVQEIELSHPVDAKRKYLPLNICHAIFRNGMSSQVPMDGASIPPSFTDQASVDGQFKAPGCGGFMAPLSEKTLHRLAVVSASYVKRLLDSHAYDQLFETDLGEKLRSLPEFQKHIAEFALHSSNVLLDEQLKGETPFEKFIKDVLTDVPAEMAQRLVRPSRPDARAATLPLVDLVAKLEAPQAEELVAWLHSAPPDERARVRAEILTRSVNEINALLALKPETRTKLLALETPSTSAPATPVTRESVASHEPNVLSALATSVQSAANSLREKREGKKKR